jgi:hypothetical protein
MYWRFKHSSEPARRGACSHSQLSAVSEHKKSVIRERWSITWCTPQERRVEMAESFRTRRPQGALGYHREHRWRLAWTPHEMADPNSGHNPTQSFATSHKCTVRMTDCTHELDCTSPQLLLQQLQHCRQHHRASPLVVVVAPLTRRYCLQTQSCHRSQSVRVLTWRCLGHPVRLPLWSTANTIGWCCVTVQRQSAVLSAQQHTTTRMVRFEQKSKVL